MQSQLAHRAQSRSLHRAAPQQRRVLARAGFFGFLGGSKPVSTPVNQRATELVEELVGICKGTDAGAKASAGKRQQITELVEELQQYCIKNPLKSKLLWGEYEVLYASKPTAVGGPLKSGAGPIFFPGQKAKQILEEPNQLVNLVEFQTLGFINGYSRQYGTIKPISGDTFLLEIERGELQTGVGAPQQREFNIQRQIQIAYLDETLRIARFLPKEDLQDDEAAGQRSEEEILFVFRRVVEEQQQEEEEAEQAGGDEEEEPAAPRRGTAMLFGGRQTQAGLATVAERDVRKKMQAEARPSSRPMAGSSLRRGRRQEEEEQEEVDPRAARAAERERRAAAEAEARAAKARAAEEEKERKRREQEEERERRRREQEERAEALRMQKAREAEEREAARQKQADIKELLATLQEEVRQRSGIAKDAAKELADLGRSQGAVLAQVKAARQQVEEAEAQTQAAAAELVEVTSRRKAAEPGLKQVQAALKEAEKAFRQKLLSAK